MASQGRNEPKRSAAADLDQALVVLCRVEPPVKARSRVGERDTGLGADSAGEGLNLIPLAVVYPGQFAVAFVVPARGGWDCPCCGGPTGSR